MSDPIAMNDVKVQVGGQVYAIACEQDQEQRLKDLARVLDSRFEALRRENPGIVEKHLFVMTAILLCDDIDRLNQKLRARDAQASADEDVRQQELDEAKTREQAVFRALKARCERISRLAEALEKEGRY